MPIKKLRMPAFGTMLLIITSFLCFSISYAQLEVNKVPDDVMEHIYNEIKTPYKVKLEKK